MVRDEVAAIVHPDPGHVHSVNVSMAGWRVRLSHGGRLQLERAAGRPAERDQPRRARLCLDRLPLSPDAFEHALDGHAMSSGLGPSASVLCRRQVLIALRYTTIVLVQRRPSAPRDAMNSAAVRALTAPGPGSQTRSAHNSWYRSTGWL